MLIEQDMYIKGLHVILLETLYISNVLVVSSRLLSSEKSLDINYTSLIFHFFFNIPELRYVPSLKENMLPKKLDE